MKIALNCRSFLNKKYTGIGRYAYHLIKNLSAIDHINQYFLYAKKKRISFNKTLPKFKADNIIMKVDHNNKGIEKALGDVDIYHSPSPDYLNINHGTKVVVTIHDLIFKTFPEGHTQKTLDDTEEQFRHIGEKADKIICCSQNTINDLTTYFNVPKDKINLVYQGVDKSVFYPLQGRELQKADKIIKSKGVHDPYVLSVGTIEPRKNLEHTLHAFDQLRTKYKFKGKLVVIGMKGWLTDGIEGLVRKLELKNDVIFLGFVSDEELRCFYNKAEAFLFPSFYEGFGFPIVEAFSCGTPVVTSNVSSCPEVAHDAALMVNPSQPHEIAEATARILGDEKLKQELIQNGFERAKYFNFRKTAEQTLSVYQDLYNGN